MVVKQMNLEQVLARTHAQQKLRLLFGCYAQAADETGVLVKDQLPMRQLASLMGDITLFELTDDDQIIYRLAGQNILDRMGIPLQGRNMLDFVHPDNHAYMLYAHKMVLRRCCGYLMIFEATYSSGNIRRIEALRLPMRAHEGAKLNGFLGFNIHREIVGIGDLDNTPEILLTGESEFSSFFDLGRGVPSAHEESSEDMKALYHRAVFGTPPQTGTAPGQICT